MAAYVKLLQLQRDLYNLPRGPERFQHYLDTLVKDDDLALPLAAMNPMAKEHIPARLDELIVLGADSIAADATAEATQRLNTTNDYRVTLVLVDDVAGGWTDRQSIEIRQYTAQPDAELKRGWRSVLLWATDPPTPDAIRSAVLTTLCRTEHLAQHPTPTTLREYLSWVGTERAFATPEPASVDTAELEYTRVVLESQLESTDFPTIFTSLYGDTHARRLGYPPLGLSDYAGCILAHHDALSSTHAGK